MYGKLFRPVVKVTKKIDKMDDVVKTMDELDHMDILTGVPQPKTPRKNEPQINNAELAYIHSNGSPIEGIPPRPFLEPAIDAHKIEIVALQSQILKAALSGNLAQAKALMKAMGLAAQGFVKDWFFDPRNGWAPNSPATYARKLKKGRKDKDPRPLIDTGQLLNSISHVVRDKNATD